MPSVKTKTTCKAKSVPKNFKQLPRYSPSTKSMLLKLHALRGNGQKSPNMRPSLTQNLIRKIIISQLNQYGPTMNGAPNSAKKKAKQPRNEHNKYVYGNRLKIRNRHEYHYYM